MSQSARITALVQRIGTEFKAIRSERGNMTVRRLTKAQYQAIATPRGTNVQYIITDWSDATNSTAQTNTVAAPSGGGTAQTATLLPTANGSKATGWANEGSTDYSKMTTNDGASSAIYSPIAGDIVTYQMADLPSGAATVSSVVVHTSVMKLDPGTAVTHAVLVIGGTVYESTDQTPVNSGAYEDLTYTWSTNPATGAAWTVAAVNAMEVGIKKINAAGERCSYISAVVSYS
jgi:hypothetical protein